MASRQSVTTRYGKPHGFRPLKYPVTFFLEKCINPVVLCFQFRIFLRNALPSEAVFAAPAFFVKLVKLCLSSGKHLNPVSFLRFLQIPFKSCHGFYPPFFVFSLSVVHIFALNAHFIKSIRSIICTNIWRRNCADYGGRSPGLRHFLIPLFTCCRSIFLKGRLYLRLR